MSAIPVSAIPVADRTALVPSQDDPGIPGPSIPEPPAPEPATPVQAAPEPAAPAQTAPEPVLSPPSDPPASEQIQIPWVVGYPIRNAESILATAGLNIGSVTTESSLSQAGTVLRTDPSFGSAVEPGRAINLVVAGP
ncbi:MAG TPA: PASTA domain-containing protein [Pseudonocardia sp.]